MQRRIHRSRRSVGAGINLINAAVAAAIFGVVSMGTVSAMLTALRLDTLTKERNLAAREAEKWFQLMLIKDREQFFKTFVARTDVDTATNSTGGTLTVNTDGLTTFKIEGLEPQDNTNATGVIRVQVAEEFETRPQESDIFTVHIQIRWKGRRRNGDFEQNYTMVISPPDRFD